MKEHQKELQLLKKPVLTKEQQQIYAAAQSRNSEQTRKAKVDLGVKQETLNEMRANFRELRKKRNELCSLRNDISKRMEFAKQNNAKAAEDVAVHHTQRFSPPQKWLSRLVFGIY